MNITTRKAKIKDLEKNLSKEKHDIELSQVELKDRMSRQDKYLKMLESELNHHKTRLEETITQEHFHNKAFEE